MKVRIFVLVAMVALVGLLIRGPVSTAAAAAATAQATPTDSGMDFKDYPGIQRGVSRTYAGDFSALFGSRGTPGAEVGTPDISAIGLFSLNGAIFQFEDGDKAKDAYGKLSDQVLLSTKVEGGFDFKEAHVDGFSDNTRAYSAAIAEQGMSSTVFLVVTQQDKFIYLTTGISFSPEASVVKDATVGFTKALIAGKVGEGDGDVKDNGTSTGGLWDKFPAADDKALQGLKPAADQQVYPKK